MQEEMRQTLVRAVRDDPLIQVLAEVSETAGTRLFLVGGWLRDRGLERFSLDYDFIVDGDVAALARQAAAALGGSFFTLGREPLSNYRIVARGATLDLVSQHPDGLLAELGRRDFPINTLAFGLRDETFYDPFHGLQDIGARLVRMVSPEVLEADPLRMLRAVRFCAVLSGFRLSGETAAAIRRDPSRLSKSAAERVREEMDRIMLSARAAPVLSLMLDLGLFDSVFPELLPLKDLYQGPYHHLDALTHTVAAVEQTDDLNFLEAPFLYAFDLTPEDRLVLGYALLFHDVSKAESRTTDPDGRPHFYGHEKQGAEKAAELMARYAFPRKRSARICRLIRYHVVGLGLIKAGYTEKALRRIVGKLGADLPLHVLHALADRRAARGERFEEMEQRTIAVGQALLDTYHQEGLRIMAPPPLIDGQDVMTALGLTPSPAVGEILDKIRKLQVDRAISTREEALAFVIRLKGESSSSGQP
ncbi:MAG: HD domain-containing protein [bacterium]|nr:HD domain-containing protein [bacterium]